MLFPFINSNRTAEDGEFNIFTVENLVSSLAVPNNLPAKLPKTNILPPPSTEAETARRENLSRFITFAVVQFAVVVFLTAIAGSGVGFFVGAILMAGFIVSLNNAGKNSKIDLEVRLEGARRDWEKIETEWSSFNVAPNFNDDLALVRRKITEHHQLQQQTREQAKLLRGEVFNYKLETFLASFKIGDAKIAGVERQKLELLKTFGIRSAADIDANRFQSLPPVFSGSKNKLIEWRKNLERQFVYDSNAEVPEADQKRLTEGFTEKRGRIEREIENLLVSLRSNSTGIKQRQQFLSTRAEAVSKQLLQSESDLAAAGNTTIPIIVLIIITTLIPMFGNAMFSPQKRQIDYPYAVSGSEPQVKLKAATPSSLYISDNSNSAMNVYGYTVPDSLTDEQIKNLDDVQKASGAQQLLDRANNLVESRKDYKTAEKRLELALKLEPMQINILNKMGSILYEQKQYDAAMTYLNKSLSINPKLTETNFLIGNIHLKKENFLDAHNVFMELTNQNHYSYEILFNLGQADKGLKDYDSAINTFRAAIDIKSNNADAHYELAFCLNKAGLNGEFAEEYYILQRIDTDMAQKLRKELKLKNIPKIEMEETLEKPTSAIK